jgi:hypothetical protein
LLWRSVSYWAFCIAALTIMLLIWNSLLGAEPFWNQIDDVWYRHAPAVVAVTLLLPLLLIDVLRVSNRFAGPIYRMRRVMTAMAKGERVDPISIRKGDFWHDFIEDFNTMLKSYEPRAVDKTFEAESHDQQAEACAAK